MYIDSQERVKFDSKLRAGIFIGYSDRSKAYKIINPDSNHVYVSRNVRFFEERAWYWSGEVDSTTLTCEPTHDEGVAQLNEAPQLSPSFNQIDKQLDITQQVETFLLNDETPIAGEDGGAPTRYRKLTDIYNLCSLALSAEDPISYEDAATKQEWITAMKEEINTINKNQTWKLTTLSKRRKQLD